MTRYGPKHPELAKVRAEIADINSQLGQEIDQIVANMRNEYRVAADRERLLEQTLERLKEQQSVSKGASVTLRDLEREAETSRRVFETFLNRYKQTLETQDLQLADARIVEKADIPAVPTSPKRPRIVILGLLAGLGLGLGITLLLELLSRGVARPEDAEITLGVPHLASVPLLKRQADGLNDPLLAMRVVLAQPEGVFAQELARIARGLSDKRIDSSPRVLQVVSSLPNEGKSVIAANLALLHARQGMRTLLVDADLRRSSLSQHLGVEHAPGLLDAIGHGLDFDSVLLRDTVSGLAVLPAGGGRMALPPAEALQAPGFGQRLVQLKTHFDIIVVDGPPIIPVVDARILANYADAILFVVAWERTPKEIVRRAVSLLGSNDAKIAGLVINQVDPVAHMAARRHAMSRRKADRAAPRAEAA
jgi:polysaccharide biosynthesis transport protein